jgi:hypothetical protein
MSQAFTHLVGIAGLALFLANFAPDALSASIAAFQPQTSAAADEASPVNRALKADRAPMAQPSPRPTAVSSIELVGVSQTTVILRDRLGQVLYRSDPLTNTTVASKNADIPSITVKETLESPTVTRSAPVPERKEGIEDKGKRSVPAGCEAVVSPLVSHELRRVPSLCLTLADEGKRHA